MLTVAARLRAACVRARPGLAGGAAAAAVLLTGCGLVPGSDGAADDGSSDSPSADAKEDSSDGPTPLGGARGTLDLEALSGFECAQVDEGRWAAEGRVTNVSGRPASFVVTVLVAGGEGATATGLRTKVPALPPGDSARFDLQPLPVAGSEDLTCQVQVVRRS